MITVEDIRKSMRISHTSLDSDIQRNMDACLLDMKRVGINIVENEQDALIGKAMEIYCKADFDYQNKGEQFRKSYESLRDALSLCGDYRKEPDTDV